MCTLLFFAQQVTDCVQALMLWPIVAVLVAMTVVL
jgi:hypothetical protein